jgi:hypothetical protein
MIRNKLKTGLLTGAALASLSVVWLPGQTAKTLQSAMPKISVRSYKVVAPAELGGTVTTLERSTCGSATSSMSLTTEDLAGGKVKAIRVLRAVRWGKPPKPKELRTIMEKVWEGRVPGAACGILWDEVSLWSVEAALEFQDGKRGLLVTDGSHIALKDHDGRIWFTRLASEAHDRPVLQKPCRMGPDEKPSSGSQEFGRSGLACLG